MEHRIFKVGHDTPLKLPYCQMNPAAPEAKILYIATTSHM